MNDAALTVPDSLFDPARPPAPEQKLAVETAATSRVMVLTGGPGTGKTFTTNSIVRMLHANKLEVALAAPTGKAAIRMREQTGEPAQTIHRLLGWTTNGWTYDATVEPIQMPDGSVVGGPLPCDVLVLDEVSMIDTSLMAAVLRALTPRQRLILVGDVDQLPSIGEGQILRDLIDSNAVPVVKLTKIFRQASESLIPYVAREIRDGRMETPIEDMSMSKGSDVAFVQKDAESHIAQLVVHTVTKEIPARGYAMSDIQVLCPQKSGPIGVEELNAALQVRLNPNVHKEDGLRGSSAAYKLHLGDRVLHTKNNYEIGVANGEIGTIIDLDFKGINVDAYEDRITVKEPLSGQCVMAVDYGDRVVVYGKQDVYDVDLGYAITIHKSQGSQFPFVVMPVHEVNQFMLTRQLVYTAVTRAEKALLLIGQEKALHDAASNERGLNRTTKLKERIVA